MTALIYLSVAVFSGILSVRVLWRRRVRAYRRDFAWLAGLTSTTTFLFASFLLTGAAWLRPLYGALGAQIPLLLLRLLHHFFRPQDAQDRRLLRDLGRFIPPAAAVLALLDLAFTGDRTRPGWPSLLLGLLVWGTFGLVLLRLARMYRQTPSWIEQARIRYLLVLVAGSAGFTMVEGLARLLRAATPRTGHLAVDVWLHHGSVPPIGALFTGLTLWTLYQVVSLERLVDLHEIFARVGTLALGALALVGLEVLFLLLGAPPDAGLLAVAYLLFLASLVFLLAWQVSSHRLERLVSRALGRREAQFRGALDALDRRLDEGRSRPDIGRMLVDALHDTGRFDAVAVYVLDADRRRMRRVAWRDVEDRHPPEELPAPPPGDGPLAEGNPLVARLLARSSGPRDRALLAALEAMRAEVVIPMVKRGVVLGWVGVRSSGLDGELSREQARRLARTVQRAAGVVENLLDIEAIREQDRLMALGTMAAGLAHEIRNPLAGIKGAGQYLQGLDLPEEAREFLQIVIDEVDRLNHVVSSFLLYARQPDPDLGPVDVGELVERVATLVRAQGLPPGVELETVRGHRPAVARADPDQLRQVLLNLLQNAVEAVGASGRVTVTVRRAAAPSAGQEGEPVRGEVEIEVADDGPGIDEAVRERLFVPFFTTRQEGTGLGLAISQRIVQAHGGTIRTAPNHPRGSRFIVRLPGAEAAP